MLSFYRRSTLAGLGCLLPTIATAQLAEEGKIETVTVTATKRPQLMQDVPQTITAFSERSIKDAGASDFSGLLNSMAGVELRQQQAGQGGVAIRGISELNMGTLYGGTGSATGMYLDEMPLTAAGRFPGLGTFDMQRVEVLKGPQGTLFGEGSLAGTVRFIANKPRSDKVEAAADARYARTEHGGNSHLVNVMANLPLAGNVAAMRVTAYRQRDGGYLDANITDGRSISAVHENANDGASKGARVAVRVTPTPDLILTGTYLHYQSDNGTRNRGATPLAGAFSTAEYSSDKLDAVNLNAEYTLGFADLVGSYSHSDRNVFVNEDQGKTLRTINDAVIALRPLATGVLNVPWPDSADGVSTGHAMHAKADTVEVRLVSNGDGSLTWTGGLFYKKTSTGFIDDGKVTPAILPASWEAVSTALTRGAGTVSEALHTESIASIKQTALFGEVSNDFSKGFQVLVGGRVFKETRTSLSSWRSAFALLSGGNARGSIRSRDEASLFNPKVTASYKLSPGTMAYGTWSQGFRSGGQNDYQVYIPGSPADYEPERLINQELGIKTMVLDNTLALNVALYAMKWKDLQQIVARGSSGIGSAIGNVGDAGSRGLDLEAKWVPIRALEINFAASMLNAVLDNPVVLPPSAGGITVPEGARIPGTSKRTFSLGASYRRPVGASLTGFAGARVNSRSDFTSELINYAETTAGSTTLDLRFGVEARKWQLYAFVDNATDRRVAVRKDGDGPDIFSGEPNYFWARPRTVGINFRTSL